MKRIYLIKHDQSLNKKILFILCIYLTKHDQSRESLLRTDPHSKSSD